MIEHTGIPVQDFAKMKAFYETVLPTVGYTLNYDMEDAAGFMEGGHTSIWVSTAERGAKLHVAFRAKDKKQVDEFHKAGLDAGGTDNGAPGYRSDYSPDYYAAFIHDPEGNNIEAVWYDPDKSE
jgi:catechol 2,3-dioxygenase-like lactoylglutathione lyase family enzyme